MSNEHNERILEELFYKHLKIVEKDLDLPQMIKETIATARARAESSRSSATPRKVNEIT